MGIQLESVMNKFATTLTLSLLVFPAFSLSARAQTGITEQEAHSIGVDAYLYFYSLLSMDITRKQFTTSNRAKRLAKVR